MSLSVELVASLAAVAFLAGLVDAVAGGGGLLTLPALLAAGLPPHAALATNKGQSVFGAASAALAYARKGALDVALARFSFPLGLIGSLAGAQLVLWLSPATLRPVVLVLLPTAAVAMLLRRDREAGEPVLGLRRIVRASLLALGVGAYDGFFGPGTGTFLIVGFNVLLAMPLLRATADAKVVNLASNLAAVLMFSRHGEIRWGIAIPMGLAQLVGSYLGAHLALRGGDKFVRAGVVVVVLALVAKLGFDLR